MSREIKFRAWCERDKTMYQEIGLHPFISQDHTKADEDSSEYVHESAGKGLFTLWPNQSSWPIMQYTGLKDKNGVEIYEGDILKWVAKNEGKKGQIFNNVVYFLEYRYRIKGTKNGKTFHCDLTSNQIFNHECEVIGNIHQNPELL